MEEISSNSDILRYISGDGEQEDITEDSFIVVDRQTEPEHRSQQEQEEMEKSKLEQMMASVSMQTSGCGEAPSTSKQENGQEEDQTVDHTSVQSSGMFRSVDIEETTRLKDTVKLLEAKLRSNNQVVRNALDQLQAVNELKLKNDELQQQVLELQSKVDDLVLSPTASSDELLALRVQLEVSKKEVEDCKRKIAEVEELYQLQIVQNNELKEKIRNGTLENVIQSQSKDVETSDEFITLNAVVSSLDLELEMTKKKLEDAVHKFEVANSVLALRDMEISELKTSLEQANEKAAKFREDVTEKIEHLTQSSNEMEKKLQEALAEKQLYQDKCGQLGRQMKELLEEIDRARQVPHSSENHMELERLRQRFAIMEKENTELRTQVAALTTEQEHINHWKAQCEVYRSDYEQVVLVKDQLNNRVLELSQELENTKGQLELMTSELSDAHAQRARLAQHYVQRTESSPTSSSSESMQSRSGPESIKSAVKNAFTLTNEVGRFLRPRSTSSSGPSSVNTPTNNSSATAPPSDEGGAAGGSRPDPCPLCLKSFPTVEELVEHSATCGEMIEPYGSNMEPFIVVPNQ